MGGTIRNLSPPAGRMLDAAAQAKKQKAASVALSLRRAATFKRTDEGHIEIFTVKGVKRRTFNFGARVVAGFRSEHTIGSFLYPQVSPNPNPNPDPNPSADPNPHHRLLPLPAGCRDGLAHRPADRPDLLEHGTQ